jgi:hypothetical protein
MWPYTMADKKLRQPWLGVVVTLLGSLLVRLLSGYGSYSGPMRWLAWDRQLPSASYVLSPTCWWLQGKPPLPSMVIMRLRDTGWRLHWGTLSSHGKPYTYFPGPCMLFLRVMRRCCLKVPGHPRQQPILLATRLPPIIRLPGNKTCLETSLKQFPERTMHLRHGSQQRVERYMQAIFTQQS